ncbi:hypothetical protein [Streptomyces montanisoli]|uniref:Secreted protein n=1 Tax=Streptomyces montanisoli TaxID=2798581 RepID=A0A940MI92_9ACTN|nr:hypothetical protein [Streptomyces montanisoli]MBP0461719.1 hypothetical protein [Streptomyces montanisoli]
MSTVLIVIGLIVVCVIVVALVLYAGPRRGRGSGKAGLRRRFGPEYDLALARHGGDATEAEHELRERVQRHGGLRVRPLPAERRERYMSRWAGLQERFVEAPHEAVVQADALVAELAAERGYPVADSPQAHDEQLDALSVHHAHRVGGYRTMHHAAARAATEGGGVDGGVRTEELREAMVGARGLFEQLILADGGGHGGRAAARAGRKDKIAMRPKGSGA